MNLAIHGIDNKGLGARWGDTFARDQHADVQMDYVLANPPFNIKDWSRNVEDTRWKYGVPPASNANYGWIQHILSKLAPRGRAGVVMANGSMSSNSNGEGQIRAQIVEADLVSCMVALPPQLFRSTGIPVCLWFFAKDKGNRAGEVLFVDAREMGYMVDRAERALTADDVVKIGDTFHAWLGSQSAAAKRVEYVDLAGFCRSVSLAEIKEADYALTPGRYVGSAELNDDGESIQARLDRRRRNFATRWTFHGGVTLSCVMLSRSWHERMALGTSLYAGRKGEISYGIVQPGAHDPDGVPIVRVRDMAGDRIEAGKALRVSPDVSARHQRTVLQGGELLISVVGTVGLVAVVPPDLAGWNVARAIAVIRPEGVSAEWLRLCLTSRAVITQITSVLNTTVQATLNLSDLKKVAVPMPPERMRSAVTAAVGALDDMVAANRSVVRCCSRLASAYWHSVASELRPLSDLARFVNGRAFTKNASGVGRVVVRIAELNSGLGASTVRSDIAVADDHVARPGDLLFAWSGSLTVARWFRPEAIINQHIFKVMPADEIPMWLVDQAVRSKLEDFRAIAADKATTMGHIQRAHLDQPVAVPPQSEIDRLDRVMQGLWDRALAAELETLQLERTREMLMPLLMSGQITSRDLLGEPSTCAT